MGCIDRVVLHGLWYYHLNAYNQFINSESIGNYEWSLTVANTTRCVIL